jgi:hypothetical protein
MVSSAGHADEEPGVGEVWAWATWGVSTAVRHAAVIGTLRLLDTKQPTLQQQAEHSPLIQEVLAECTNRYHRAVALGTLDAWGHDTTAYQPVQPAITADDEPWAAWNNAPSF